MMGFVGFGALSGDLGYVPTSLGNDEADSSVDADFRMVLRKLTKKDSTTKLKVGCCMNWYAVPCVCIIFRKDDSYLYLSSQN